jgi:hypothetical protein
MGNSLGFLADFSAVSGAQIGHLERNGKTVRCNDLLAEMPAE